MAEVAGGVKQYTALPIPGASCHKPPEPIVPDHLWIAEILAKARRGRGNNRVMLVLAKVNAIAAKSRALHFFWGTGIIMGCVNKGQFAAIVHRAPGEAAFLVTLIRHQRKRQVLPMHEVVADHMASVHGPPFRAIRMMLIEGMVFSLVLNEAVGIIHPSPLGHYVEFQPKIILFCSLRQFFALFFLVHFIIIE
jgi:hypothetical protein